MNKKHKLELLYRIIIVIVSGTGLYLNFKLASPKKMLLYFTIISNIMVFLFYSTTTLLDLIQKLKKSHFYYAIDGIVTVFIILTMCVYQIALTDTPIYSNHLLECSFVHIITPMLVLLYYFVFTEKGHMKKYYSIIWIIPLFIYAFFVQVYSHFGGRFLDNQKFPYPFLDVDKNGYIHVLMICVLFIIALLMVGEIAYYTDKYLEKREENGKKRFNRI